MKQDETSKRDALLITSLQSTNLNLIPTIHTPKEDNLSIEDNIYTQKVSLIPQLFCPLLCIEHVMQPFTCSKNNNQAVCSSHTHFPLPLSPDVGLHAFYMRMGVDEVR